MLKKPRGTKEKVNERPIARSHLQSHEQTTAPSRAQAGGQPAAPSQRAAVGAGSRTHPPAGAAPARRHGAPIAAFRAAPSWATDEEPRAGAAPPSSPSLLLPPPALPTPSLPGGRHRIAVVWGRSSPPRAGLPAPPAAPAPGRSSSGGPRPSPAGGGHLQHTHGVGSGRCPAASPPPPRRSAPLTRRHGGQPEPRWMDALWLPRLLEPLSAQLCPPPPGKLQARGAHCPPRSSWQPYRAGNVPTAQ